jgi:hypothetical protein
MSNAKKRYSGIVMGGIILLKQCRNARAGVRSRHTKQQAHQSSTHGVKHSKTRPRQQLKQTHVLTPKQFLEIQAPVKQSTLLLLGSHVH